MLLNATVRKNLPLAITLVVGTLVTLGAWRFVQDVEHERSALAFSQRVDNTADAILDRFAAYQQVLHGGAALLHASRDVSRNEWRVYVEHLMLEEMFPGIQGVGYAVNLGPDDLMAHERAVRADGFPDYRVHPQADRASRPSSAILYLEPFDVRNQRAFGYDMYSNAIRRAAMANSSRGTAVMMPPSMM